MSEKDIQAKGKEPSVSWCFQLVYACLLLMMVIAFLLLMAGAINSINAARSSSWPSTPGVIQQSSIEREPSVNPGHPSDTYRANVVYTYEVNGQEYEGNLVSFRVEQGTAAAAQALASQFSVGQEVTVYYKAAVPKYSVLQPGASWRTAFPALVGTGLGVVAGIWLLVMTRKLYAMKLAAQQRKAEAAEAETEAAENS